MGTMLYAKGFFLNVCYDELNLKQPRLVQEVHAEYVRAGAEILETNTFGANPLKLNSYGLADETRRSTARRRAGAAAGGKASVVGAIGPLGIRIEPFGPTSKAEAKPRSPAGKGLSRAVWTASSSKRSATWTRCMPRSVRYARRPISPSSVR
jgi:S-methylmethionine-dependent homocysteine/selenocysteine methylase